MNFASKIVPAVRLARVRHGVSIVSTGRAGRAGFFFS